MKKTPLYSTHVRSGARMAAFSGWHMPIHYGSQIEEHRQVRRDAGMFDVSHMGVIDVEGTQSRTGLRRLLANDIDRLDTPGKALYSCMLREDAGIIDDLIVYSMGTHSFRLVVNAGTTQKDLQWMRENTKNIDIRFIERTDLAILAVQGPQAQQKIAQAFPAADRLLAALASFQAALWENAWIARTGYSGEDGYEIIMPADDLTLYWQRLSAVGVMPCGLGARDTLRLEAGLNLYGQDMDEHHHPLDSGLDWTVDARDPNRVFIGQSAWAQSHQQMSHIPQLTGLILQARGLLRADQTVHSARGTGSITSGGYSPSLDASLALARLPRGLVPGDRVTVSVRSSSLPAVVVRPPFVRRGRILVNPSWIRPFHEHSV
jgi:aminomethyltransferase